MEIHCRRETAESNGTFLGSAEVTINGDNRMRLPKFCGSEALIPLIRKDAKQGGIYFVSKPQLQNQPTPSGFVRYQTLIPDRQRRVSLTPELQALIGGSRGEKRILGMGSYMVLYDPLADHENFGREVLMGASLGEITQKMRGTVRQATQIELNFDM